MKVFISWSGTRSRRTAELLRTWLPLINQDFDPFVSGEDISKGGNWSQAIIDELNKSEFGILCVTPGNQVQPWLLFEAGALSKQVDNNPILVAPLLIGFKGKRDLPPPLGRFQTTLPTKEDMFKLVKALNDTCAEDRQRDQFSLKTVFEKWWDDFEGPFAEIENSEPTSPSRPRSDSDVLAEVLDIVRSLQRRAPQSSTLPSTAYLEAVNRNLAALIARSGGRTDGFLQNQLVMVATNYGLQLLSSNLSTDPIALTIRDRASDPATVHTRMGDMEQYLARDLGLDAQVLLDQS